MRWHWVAIALIADALVYLFHGWRWQLLLRPVEKVSFLNCVQAIYVGLFANEVLPLRAGELIRCFLLSRSTELPISVTFASALIERIFDGIWLMTCFFMALHMGKLPGVLIKGGYILGIMIVAAGIIIGFAMYARRQSIDKFFGMPWPGWFQTLIEDLHLIGHSRYLYYSFIASGAYLLAQIFPIYALVQANDLPVRWTASFTMMVLLRLSSVVPQAPGNLGSFQWVVARTLIMFGLAAGHAKRFFPYPLGGGDSAPDSNRIRSACLHRHQDESSASRSYRGGISPAGPLDTIETKSVSGLIAFLLTAFLLDNPALETEGLQALEQRNYTRAEEIFTRILATDPKDYSAHFNLAFAETALQKDEQAIEQYKESLAIKPGLYEAELNLGMVYLRDKRAADAVPLLKDASIQKADQVRPKRYLAESLLAIGEFAAAAEAFKQSLAIDPKSAPAELGLGQSLARQGKLDEALPHYRTAAELDPKLQSYLLELEAAYAKANRPQDAIALLKQFPENPGAREELGRLYLSSKQAALAVLEFKAAVTVSPTPANRLALASAYLQNNQADLAEPILTAALAENPKDYDIRMAVGRIRRDRHDYPAAANQFYAAAQAKPESVEAWKEMAASCVLAEQYQQALAALEQVHKLNAETAGDFYLRAIVLDKFHQVKPALANYQQFLERSGGKNPDEEFKARQRSRILQKEVSR